MKNLSLILRILAIVAAVSAAGLYFMTEGKLAEMQTKLDAANADTQRVLGELSTANDEISTQQTQLAEERESLAKTKRELEAARSESQVARREVTRTQQELREAKAEIGKLNDENKRLRSDLLSAEQNLAEASKEGEIAQLNERIQELESANSDLKSDLQAADAISSARTASAGTASSPNIGSDGLPDYSLPVNNNPAVLPASIGTATTIASVSAENGLIVLDTTPELALTIGTEVTLVQDLKAIGTVKIVSTQDNLALANILPGSKTREMTAGTSVNLLR